MAFGIPSVTLHQGTFKGLTSHGSALPQILDLFLGIPYALPPTGPRRFQPPHRIPPSTATYSATHWTPRSPSSGPAEPSALPFSEDCLTLNVFRPQNRDPDGKLPVLVYIHGGAFNFGGAKEVAISSLVAWAPKPMLGISFNYRLGALGFLPSRVLEREGGLNLGIRDQRLLLEWVRENVGSFGGDAGNVTLMGASAGAHSIGHHLMANTDKPPLFHKVIMESGAPTARAVYPYDHPLHQKQFEDFLHAVGCSDVPEDQVLSHLRTLPLSTIVSASEIVYQKYFPTLRWAFQPTIEGPSGYISKAPIAAWRSGDWHRVPILTGFNTNEGSTFVNPNMSKPSQFRAFFETLLPGLSSLDLDNVDALYPDPSADPSSPYRETRRGLGAQFKRAEAAYGQWAYVAPIMQTVEFASAATKPDSKSSTSPPPYLYQYALNKSANYGAGHGDQTDFVTQVPGVIRFSETQAKIAGVMHAYWTSFILTGNPNTVKGHWPDRTQWSAYQVGSVKRMIFGEGNDEWLGGDSKGDVAKVASEAFAQKECEFWWSKTDIFER